MRIFLKAEMMRTMLGKKKFDGKVTLHTVSEDSDWHFLTATSRQEKKNNLKSPFYPNIKCPLGLLLEAPSFCYLSLNSFFPTAANNSDFHSSDPGFGPRFGFIDQND